MDKSTTTISETTSETNEVHRRRGPRFSLQFLLIVVTGIAVGLAMLVYVQQMRRHELALQNAKSVAQLALMQLHWEVWETDAVAQSYAVRMSRQLGGSATDSWTVDVIYAPVVTHIRKLNPATLDTFEKQAIKQIQAGAIEFDSGLLGSEFRYAQALAASKSCVDCHFTFTNKPFTGPLAVISVRRKPS